MWGTSVPIVGHGGGVAINEGSQDGEGEGKKSESVEYHYGYVTKIGGEVDASLLITLGNPARAWWGEVYGQQKAR